MTSRLQDQQIHDQYTKKSKRWWKTPKKRSENAGKTPTQRWKS
jgi:hypothetical protein